jgi:hypothetical protein
MCPYCLSWGHIFLSWHSAYTYLLCNDSATFIKTLRSQVPSIVMLIMSCKAILRQPNCFLVWNEIYSRRTSNVLNSCFIKFCLLLPFVLIAGVLIMGSECSGLFFLGGSWGWLSDMFQFNVVDENMILHRILSSWSVGVDVQTLCTPENRWYSFCSL